MAYEELFTDLLKAEREEDVTWAGELSRDCFQRPALAARFIIDCPPQIG
jgi:hypothetical protein